MQSRSYGNSGGAWRRSGAHSPARCRRSTTGLHRSGSEAVTRPQTYATAPGRRDSAPTCRLSRRRSYASAEEGPVTIGSFARQRSERVPDRGPGETVMADGDRVLALKNRRARLLKSPDVRAIRRVGGERGFAVHRDVDRDLEAEQLVEQAQSQCVVDADCPLVHRVECRGGNEHRVRWRELVGLV